ncbi:MAG: hypothetical protein HPY90_07035 [Syntrophothermus sp.]|uniref:hypothetical protein n=1 Tax=Syntrophothermus sp. TaxID=2736299 RepID=UPI00257E107F|nr:hypothetical protein [Syntrophothermus sp.]NSW83019.1 hypothetical protein [Syntrophothermus sp.]
MMTKFQVIFLLVAMMYLVAKVILGFIIYLVTLQIEAAARERQRKRRTYLSRVRARDRELYKEAYQWYQKRNAETATVVPLPVPEPEVEEAHPVSAQIPKKRDAQEKTRLAERERLREIYEY